MMIAVLTRPWDFKTTRHVNKTEADRLQSELIDNGFTIWRSNAFLTELRHPDSSIATFLDADALRINISQ